MAEKICGIYMIQSKIKPERVYIGSSVNINKRWGEHRRDLIKGVHRSIKLQRHADKYGNNDLEYLIIEQFSFISKKHLLEREQYYLDGLNPYFCICKSATNTRLGCKSSIEHRTKIANSNRGKKCSEESNRKKSERQKGKKLSAETRLKISIALKGRPKSKETIEKFKNKIVSDETKLKMSNSRKGKKSPQTSKRNKGNTYGRKNKGKVHTPEMRERQSKQALERWAKKREADANRKDDEIPINEKVCIFVENISIND